MNNNQNQSNQTPTPIIAQPVIDTSERMAFKKNYIFSIAGLLRLAIILAQFAGWISAAAVPKYLNGNVYLPPELSATRDGYLFFSITGFIIAIGIYLINLFNMNKIGPFKKLPVEILLLATDILWVIPTFILAIVCAVRESSVKSPLYIYSEFVNIGAFASASFFGFLACLFYGIDILFHIFRLVRRTD